MQQTVQLGSGGPFDRLERASRLSVGGLTFVFLTITWIPLIVFSLVEFVVHHKVEPVMGHLAVHVRFLVAVPLLLVAQRQLDHTSDIAIGHLFEEGFVQGAAATRLRATLARVERLCASPWPEIVLFGLAIAGSTASWFENFHAPGVMHVIPRHGLVGRWLFFVSMPVFQFLLWRSLFRWALWARILFAVSRVRLRLLPTHADRRGGIGFLKRPSVVYCALLLLGVSSVLCAGWTNEVMQYGVPLIAFKRMFYVFVVVGSIIAFGPLVLFLPQLFAVRRAGRRHFDALLTDYSQRFERRWFSGVGRDELLGTSDAQSLADLGNSYRETIDKMQLLLFERKDVIVLFVVSQLPAIPLMLSQMPAREVISKVLHVVSGTGLG